MPGNSAPGWYPDPRDPAILRWWDGGAWSGETRSAASGGAAAGDPALSVGGSQEASWREPALQAWAAEYRAAGHPAEAASSPARAWLIGGAAAAVVVGVAAWLLTGLLAGGHGASRAAARVFHGGRVTDLAAGVGYAIPADAGWVRVARPADGFTLMFRQPAGRAVAASEPLPAAFAYRGTRDLRADGVRAAGAIAVRYFSWRGKVVVTVRRLPQASYLVGFRVRGQDAAVVIVGREAGQRPGVLFVSVPAVMNQRLAAQITASVRAATR